MGTFSISGRKWPSIARWDGKMLENRFRNGFLSLRVGFPILFSSFFTIRAQLLFSQTVKTRRKIIDLYFVFVLEEQIFQISTPFSGLLIRRIVLVNWRFIPIINEDIS